MPALRHKLFSGTVYTLLAVIVAQAISLVTSIAYARILGPLNLGILAIVTQLSQAIIPLSTLGLATVVTQMLPEYRRKGRQATEELLASALTVTVVAGVAISALYFLLSDYLAALYGVPEMVLYVRISAALVVVDALITLSGAIVQGFERVRRLAAINLVARAATVPVVILLALEFGVLGAVLAGVISQVLTFFIFFGSMRGVFRGENLSIRLARTSRRTSARILRTSLPLFAGFLVLRPAILFQASFLAIVVGYQQLGLFRVASGLYRIALLLPASLAVPLLPAISDMYAAGTPERTRTQLSALLRISALIALPITLLMALGARPIIEVLYGPGYVAAAPLVFLISAAAFGDTLGAVVENTLLGTGRTRQVFLLSALQAGLTFGGSYILIGMFGLVGLGVAILLNAVVYASVVGAYFLRRKEIVFREFRSVLAFALLAFAGAAALVWFGSLTNLWASALYFALVLVVEYLILTPRDRLVLRDALRAMMGRRDA